MPSIVSPLQLTVFAALAQNQGLKPFPAALASALAAFNATTVMQNFFAAVSFYKSQSFATKSTLTSLLSIGSTVCPALGNSIPASPIGTYPYLNSEYLVNYLASVDGSTVDPSGFSNLIEQTCAAYLGDGDAGKFCQGFMAVQGYLATTNQYINSAQNANQYLGPMFGSMDDLVTAGIANASTDLPGYGTDLANQGNLWNMSKLDLYGTPAGLIQQLSAQAGIRSRAIPDLQNALIGVGLSTKDIADLVNDNRVGLNNPNGLTQNQFDKLQVLAYDAMSMVTGDALTQALAILGVTTPGVNELSDLLNPVVMFPLSYPSLQTPSPDGPIPIFNSTGSVNSSITPVVNSYLPTASGCDELGKIIPPAAATANKAIQVALQQINNIPNTTLPRLANAIVGNKATPWDITKTYLPNDVVSIPAPALTVTSPVTAGEFEVGQPYTIISVGTTNFVSAGASSNTPGVSFTATAPGTGTGTALPTNPQPSPVTPQYYRAKSPGCTPATFSVPPGTNINDTNYWAPTTLGGINTMTNLPLIQAQTTPVDSSVTSYISSNLATGTGPCGTVTTCDVLGLALDSNDFATQLNTATTAVNALQTAGSLATLNTVYVNILSAANDAAVQTQITNANNAIAALSASPYVTTLNTAWTYMANLMNLSAKYTSDAGIDYFNLQPGDKNSVYAFVQNLSQYALITANGDAANFLENVADTTVLGGQAIVGAMREGRNNTSLAAANLYSANKIPSNPRVAPIPAIFPAQG
jgi:hypothetical protein